MDDKRHCYRVRLPSVAEAFRIEGLQPPRERTLGGITYEAASDGRGPAVFLCGALGPPCFHCGGVSDSLCDFPLGDVGRTCDRALCLECAPTVGADRNYCHDHDEHGRKMLLFHQPKRVLVEPGPAPRKRVKPLPKAPPESHRWRVRQGDGAVLGGWVPELDARRFAAKVGGCVETWDQFVALWRRLYPLKRGK
jgi:hypothetical protein